VAREDAIEVEGAVVEVLRESLYRVELANGHKVLAHWKRRSQAAKTLATGDRVKLEMSPFDLSKGRLI
jgi:translation initiation factor IF-1